MTAILAESVRHRYGRVEALAGVDWQVPEGALYALLGPNGAGKTTLMSIAAGTLQPTGGAVHVFGRPAAGLRAADRQWLGWVAESQRLPAWMTVAELEAYVAPLYERWDAGLADDLRRRFGLEPGRRIDSLSRGERMKVALLCALAPRPRLLLMDEPFTGLDVVVKDEIVRGLLATSGQEGCTVVISSHDLAELELLADHVGFLDAGRLLLSLPMDELRERYVRVDVMLHADAVPPATPPEWLAVERAGPRLSFIAELEPGAAAELPSRLPPHTVVDIRPASLRELFIALAARRARPTAAPRFVEVST